MSSSTSCTISPGFRGIDPAGLDALRRWCRERSEELTATGRECMAIGTRLGDDGLVNAGRELGTIARLIAAWAGDLAGHVAAIEAAQRVATDVLNAPIADAWSAVRGWLGGLVRIEPSIRAWRNAPVATAGHLHRLDAHDRSRLLADLGPAEVYTWVDQLIGTHGGAGGDAAVGDIVRALDGEDVVTLVRMLVGAGRDDEIVADVVDALAESSPEHIGDVATAALRSHREGHHAGGIVLGRLLVVGGPPAAGAVARLTIGTPAALSDAIRRGAAADPSSDPAGAIAAMTAALVGVGDVDLRVRVALDLMVATGGRTGEPWRRQLDGIITQLLVADAIQSLALIATELDTAAERVVPWLRRLLAADGGATHLEAVLDAVETGSPEPEARAVVAGYLAGALAMATRLEAAEAHRTVSDLEAFAGRLEMVLSAMWVLPSAAAVVAPGSLDVGVVAVAARADDRIDRAMWRLLDRIDERFVPDPGTYGPDLGSAFAMYDQVRNAVIRHWAG